MSDTDFDWDDLHPETRRLLSRRRFISNGGRAAAGVVVFGGLLTVVGCGGDDDDDDAGGTTDTTAAASTDDTAATTEESLYSRLGGNAAVTAVITDFVDNQVVPDERINAFFANTDLDRLKVLLIEQVGSATGGPEVYTGRDMVAAHAGMNVTVVEFNALVEDLVASLDGAGVPEQEKGELLAILGPLQSDIVTA
ncbi:MAG: group 1 truncated hemoglobin [Actinomycetota bacterium]|nr:group 1 truncated hemoglobin [Actinomycetota bacterium]